MRKSWTVLVALLAALLLALNGLSAQDTDEMDDMMMPPLNIMVSLNAAGIENDALVTLNADLSETLQSFAGFDEVITSVESVKVASNGDVYFTFDAADGVGGIAIVPGLLAADMMMNDMAMDGMDALRDAALIFGDNAGLRAPKGLEVLEDLGLILVSNFGAASIRGFALDARGDTLPEFVIDDLGGVTGSIWDTHYDSVTDTLFAAGTTGTVLVYANFSEDFGASGPARLIVPADADGEQISINLHGIHYDAELDVLLLTDVGSPEDATDGLIFVISGVSMAEGNTPVDLAIAGPESMLGNPVDLAWDGSGIYVAEKANDLLLYYADILDRMGMIDAVADIVLEITKPESVALIPVPEM